MFLPFERQQAGWSTAAQHGMAGCQAAQQRIAFQRLADEKLPIAGDILSSYKNVEAALNQ